MQTQQTTIDAGIRRQMDRLLAGIRAMDLEAVLSVYAPDIVSFDVQPPLQVVGVDLKRKNWEEAFAVFQPPLDYEIRDLSITVDGDLAFAHSLNRLSRALPDGQRAGFWVRATSCWRRIDGEWLIAHDHVSAPMDPASGQALRSLEP